MGTRGVALVLLAAVLLQALRGVGADHAEEAPIDENSRVAARLSGEEGARRLGLRGANSLGDIVALKNYMNTVLLGRLGLALQRRSLLSSSIPAVPTSGCHPPSATSRLRASSTLGTNQDSRALIRRTAVGKVLPDLPLWMSRLLISQLEPRRQPRTMLSRVLSRRRESAYFCCDLLLGVQHSHGGPTASRSADPPNRLIRRCIEPNHGCRLQ
ncbi:hypothetical protein E2562_025285 [Oryza meyeriana var. granulata]|uniref:Uncharacterized protein n=1 Tax=Oryza meyeriana var. granulata TaxID=110450 RepID=A0A6G1BP22_9ORYZ|nr:hypothetical protein E2562_025285 [Oryza meyeriana var. granulata]